MSESDNTPLSLETFSPVVGQIFEVVFTDGRLPLTLADVRSMGAPSREGGRSPFALTFHGKPGLRLPQQIYRLENATLGAKEIFIVQVGDDAQASKFEAIFN
ncbi:MAG TPA: hypothetical protein VGM54_01860 [Chthoniobacter sp.]|jgi:hypothetical protein